MRIALPNRPPRAPRRRAPRASLALLLLALLIASRAGRAVDLEGLPTLSGVATDTLSLPTAGVRGLAFHAEGLWLLGTANLGLAAPESSFTGVLLDFRPSTGQLDTLLMERDAFESGLAFDGEFLWGAGSLLGERAGLYQIDFALREVVLGLPLPGYHPGGLAFDGTYLWLTDCDTRKLYRLDVEEGRVSRKIPAPGFYPTGLAYDGFNFWCADASTGRLYRLRGTNGRVSGVLDSSLFFHPGEFVSLGWDGRALWVVGAADSVAVRLEMLR